jgi:YgiT-type zinc finger domain-containing protein
MGNRHEDKEEVMNCHVCGSELKAAVTDMPFKVSHQTIVVLKELPLLQCANCGEFLVEDPVMARVEAILANIDREVELEIVRFAA